MMSSSTVLVARSPTPSRRRPCVAARSIVERQAVTAARGPRVVPQPQPVWPVLGNLPQLEFDVMRIPAQVAKLYGEMGTNTMRVALFSNAVAVRTRSYPDALRVLQWPKEMQKRKGIGLGVLQEFLGEGLASIDSSNPSYKRLLEVMNPSFRKVTTDAMLSDFAAVGGRMVDTIRQVAGPGGGEVDMQAVAGAATVDSIGLLHFRTDLGQLGRVLRGPMSADLDEGDVPAMMNDITREAQMLMLPWFLNPGLIRVLPGYARYRDAISRLDALIERVVQGRRSQGFRDEDRDVLGAILQAQDAKDGDWLTRDLVRDQLTTLFFAGSDTTASTVAWCLYELSKNQEAQRALREEVGKQLEDVGGDPAKVTAKMLDACPLLAGCMKETLRVYPPAPVIMRDAPDDEVVDGYLVPKGQAIAVDIYGLHRRPDLFPEPDRWLPERWTEGGRHAPADAKALIPFAPGPRSCIGRYFAERETQLFLCILVAGFEWTPSQEPDIAHAVTITSLNGIHLNARPI